MLAEAHCHGNISPADSPSASWSRPPDAGSSRRWLAPRVHRLSPQQFWSSPYLRARGPIPARARGVARLTSRRPPRGGTDRRVVRVTWTGDRRRRSLVPTPKGGPRPATAPHRLACASDRGGCPRSDEGPGRGAAEAHREHGAVRARSREGAVRVASGTRVALLAALLLAPGRLPPGSRLPGGLGSVVVAAASGGTFPSRSRPSYRRAVPDVSVRPQVGGVITAVHFAEGADVKAGGPALPIEAAQYEPRAPGAVAAGPGRGNARNARARRIGRRSCSGGVPQRADEAAPLHRRGWRRRRATRPPSRKRASTSATARSVRPSTGGRARCSCTGQPGSRDRRRPPVVINRIEPSRVFAVPEPAPGRDQGARAAGRLVAERRCHPIRPTRPGRAELPRQRRGPGDGDDPPEATFPTATRLWPGHS